MKTIILIGHKKRQGKDTLAAMLADITKGKVLRFADPMKGIIADTFDISVMQLEAWKNDGSSVAHDYPEEGTTWEQTYRDILQRFGTEAMKKQFGDDVWGKLMVDKIEWESNKVIIIPDFRFETEYRVLRAAFPKDRIVTVNVVRSPESYDSHVSETALDEFKYDYVLMNISDLEYLQALAVTLWDRING